MQMTPSGTVTYRRNDSYSRGDRSDPCQIKERCRVCAYVNTSYSDSLRAKHKVGLEEFGALIEGARVLPVYPAPHPLGYRCSAKLSVRDGRDGLLLGLYQPDSHRVVDIRSCPLHVGAIKNLLHDFNAAAPEGLRGWDEKSGTGGLRYVVLRAAHLTGCLSMTLVVGHADSRKHLKDLVSQLRMMGHKIKSAFMCVNATSGNSILTDQVTRLWGDGTLRERLCEFDFELSPTSFFQVNPWQAQQLYRRIEQIVGNGASGDVAWDLFSGVGPISLVLGRLGYQVVAIEQSESAVRDAKRNAKKNKMESMITSHQGAVEEQLGQVLAGQGRLPRVMVCNPSRRGIPEQTREDIVRALGYRQTEQFIYVSCDARTLARDLEVLQKAGFRLRQLESFDMFPQTDNLEWLAVLSQH